MLVDVLDIMTVVCFQVANSLENRRKSRLSFTESAAISLVSPLIFRNNKVRSLNTLSMEAAIAQDWTFQAAFLCVNVPVESEGFDKRIIAIKLHLKYANKRENSNLSGLHFF